MTFSTEQQVREQLGDTTEPYVYTSEQIAEAQAWADEFIKIETQRAFSTSTPPLIALASALLSASYLKAKKGASKVNIPEIKRISESGTSLEIMSRFEEIKPWIDQAMTILKMYKIDRVSGFEARFTTESIYTEEGTNV